MNTGLAQANGTIITFCDSDDEYSAGRLKQQVAWLESHPEFDAVCGEIFDRRRGGASCLRNAHRRSIGRYQCRARQRKSTDAFVHICHTIGIDVEGWLVS